MVHPRQAEFGARALGNRSILADPRPAANKDRINAMVKKREAFRPFAPAVLEEHLHEYFDVPAAVASLPFMTFVVGVRPSYQGLLGAVTHVDGSARVQSVSREDNEKFWRLLERFQHLTGVPILLNTSFNTSAEPIVNTPLDALNCFLSTHLDGLVIGDFLLTRKYAPGDLAILDVLTPKLAHRFALTRCADAHGRTEMFIQDRYTNERIDVSPAAYQCLDTAVTRSCSFGESLQHLRMPPALSVEVAAELWQLWERRVFIAGAAREEEVSRRVTCAAISSERDRREIRGRTPSAATRTPLDDRSSLP